MGCNWISAVPLRNGDEGAKKRSNPQGHPDRIVTRFNLSAGAPLTKAVEEQDMLIIGMGEGELANEAKAPPFHIAVRLGSVLLLPKEESYLLRNIGKQELDILVIQSNR